MLVGWLVLVADVLQSLSAIYTVLIGAVSASFDMEREHHLISRDCLANLQQCLSVSLDMLTKGIKVDDHPMIEFMNEVTRWIRHGKTGLTMSHHLFDHLLMSTEMLYGVITTFRELSKVTGKIRLPSWYGITAAVVRVVPAGGFHCIHLCLYPLPPQITSTGGDRCRMKHHRRRFSKDIDQIVETSTSQLSDLYHDHSRLMMTIHTTLATRHIFMGFMHLIHTYAGAGLLSQRFREDTDLQTAKHMEVIEEYFDANPFRRMQFSLQERWNIIVGATISSTPTFAGALVALPSS